MEENTEVKKGKRGRPQGRPTGSNTTVIEDKSILPYKIYIDADQYSVVDSTSKGKVEKAYGYFTTLGAALRKIVRMKLVNNKSYALLDYVKEYENTLKEFEEKFKF